MLYAYYRREFVGSRVQTLQGKATFGAKAVSHRYNLKTACVQQSRELVSSDFLNVSYEMFFCLQKSEHGRIRPYAQ